MLVQSAMDGSAPCTLGSISQHYQYPCHRYQYPAQHYQYPCHRYQYPAQHYQYPAQHYQYPCHRYQYPCPALLGALVSMICTSLVARHAQASCLEGRR
jgi:hypothetical protein